MSVELYLLHWLQSGTLTLGLGGLAVAVTRWAIPVGALGAAGLFLLAPRGAEHLRRAAFYGLVGGALGLLLAHAIAGAFVRPRPPLASSSLVKALATLPGNSSFPARPAAFLFGMASGFTAGGEDATALAVLWGLIAAIAEMATGFAFPTDELGGILLGLTAGWGVVLGRGAFEAPLRWLLRYRGWLSSSPRHRSER